MPNPNLPNQAGYNTYIGARYVPVFSGVNSGQWTNTVEYEPLTIVMHNGNSYTSKTYVPIGIDINNTTYWALTGNYNAQIEQYRQEVADMQENLNRNTNLINNSTLYKFFYNKNILILGDSNSVENEDWRGITWVTDFKNQLNGIANSITNNSTTGRNFTKVPGQTSETNNMVDIVNGLNGGDYDIIIVFCGVNDWSAQVAIGTTNVYEDYNYTQFADAVKYCLRTLHNKYNKASIYVISPMLTSDYATVTTPLIVYENVLYNLTASYTGCINFIDGRLAPAYYVDGNNATVWSKDGLHPNSDYAPILSNFILQSIISGGTPRANASKTKNIPLSNTVESTGTAFYEVYSNGQVRVRVNVTLSSNSYAGFFKSSAPDWIFNTFGSFIRIAQINKTSNAHMIEALDMANNNIYPNSGSSEVGTKYDIDWLLSPASMNQTRY